MELCVRGDWLVELSQSLEVKLVGITLSVNFCHYVLVVIVTKRPTEFVVVHVRFIFALSPPSSNLIRVDQLEFTVVSFPCNAVAVVRIRQKLQ